ncbi:MAG: ATP-binding protein [Phycisphaerales bacterium]
MLATKVTALVHELANLLDGSLRCLELAQKQLSAGGPEDRCAERPTRMSAGVSGAGPVSTFASRLDAVHSGLLQMSGLVRAFSSGGNSFAAALHVDVGYSVAESMRHAAEVLGPIAFENRARLSTEIPREFERISSPGIFGVIASGVRNAIESIQRARGGQAEGPDHSIWIKGSMGSAGDVPGTEGAGRWAWACIDIIDDGAGLSADLRESGERAFELGYTTKRGTGGIGLAIVRDTMRSLGGTVSLLSRELGATEGRHAGGAVLRLSWPVSLPSGDSGAPAGVTDIVKTEGDTKEAGA